MRIGGGIEKAYHNPEEWVKFAKDLRYSAVLCPVDSSSDQATRREYLKAAREADLLIGEVGVWRNCLAKDEMTRKAAMDYAKAQLALADEMGANCCVNIIGSHSETAWDGFSAENYSDDFYALAVDSVREIIDAVKPKNTFYTIEPMPWVLPDSPEQYLKLIQDVDRKEFAVHLDFVNMINCPERFCKSTEFVKHCFDLLGPYIKSIHCKDSVMEQAYTAIIHAREGHVGLQKNPSPRGKLGEGYTSLCGASAGLRDLSSGRSLRACPGGECRNPCEGIMCHWHILASCLNLSYTSPCEESAHYKKHEGDQEQVPASFGNGSIGDEDDQTDICNGKYDRGHDPNGQWNAFFRNRPHGPFQQ